ELAKLKREKIGVGKTHHGGAAGLRERAAIDEGRIGEVRVPVKIIVNRVVDSAAIFAAKTDVQRSDADVLEKWREVRSRTKRAQVHIGALPDVLFLIGGRVFNGAQLL